MLSYDVLDTVADAINPALGLLTLLVPWIRRKQWRAAVLINVLTLIAVGFAYALQAIDKSLGLWSAVSLDFSTHAAVFCAIASALWHLEKPVRAAVAVLALAYATLMLLQRYHSLLDLATTAAVMAVPLLLLRWWASRTFSETLT